MASRIRNARHEPVSNLQCVVWFVLTAIVIAAALLWLLGFGIGFGASGVCAVQIAKKKAAFDS